MLDETLVTWGGEFAPAWTIVLDYFRGNASVSIAGMDAERKEFASVIAKAVKHLRRERK